MPRISVAFLSVAALLAVLPVMTLSAWMGAKEDFTMIPVHAHLNLLGWVTLAIMGLFYALPSAGAAARLAWANVILSAGGVVVMILMLAWFLDRPGPPRPGHRALVSRTRSDAWPGAGPLPGERSQQRSGQARPSTLTPPARRRAAALQLAGGGARSRGRPGALRLPNRPSWPSPSWIAASPGLW